MEAQSADGVIHEFPDGTDPIVIDRAMKGYAQSQPQPDAGGGGVGGSVARMATNVFTGIPDLAIAITNHNPASWLAEKVTDALGYERTPDMAPIGPTVRKALGVPEMPADAGLGRQFLEAAIPAALTGGAGAGVAALRGGATLLPALGAAARAVVPAATATATSMAGGAAGRAVGGDAGELYGGLVGGVAPSAARAGYRAVAPGPAQFQPKPNAAAIEADARSLNLPPTPAGVLGDRTVRAREAQLSGTSGGGPVINAARDTFAAGMRDVADNIVEQRTAIPAPTPNTAPVIQLAEQTRAAGGNVGRALQEDLQNSIGGRTPVNVIPILQELERLRGGTDPGTFSPLATRKAQLVEMANEARRTSTTMGPEANVPYERIKDWRSNLGASLEGQSPVRGRFHGETYKAVTDAMRDTAERQGVHPEAFDTAQAITRDQYMGEKLAAQMARNIGQDKAAAARQFNNWWQTRTPKAQEALSGNPAIKAQLDALSRVAGEFNYPTSQTGLTQSLGGQIAHGIGTVVKRLIAGGIGHQMGGVPGMMIAGAGYDRFIGNPLEAHAARRFEAQAPQLAQGPQPPPNATPNNLARALAIASSVGSQQGQRRRQ